VSQVHDSKEYFFEFAKRVKQLTFMKLCLEIKSAVGMKWTTFSKLLTVGEESRRAVSLLLALEFVLEEDDNAQFQRRRG
jgi:hypothetical protein